MAMLVPSLPFRTFRTLFIAGYVLQGILWFVPSFRMTIGLDCGALCRWLGISARVRTFSAFSAVQFLSQQGHVGTVFVMVLLFASNIVFIALALAVPRRWVFLTGACTTALSLLFFWFSGSNPAVTVFPVVEFANLGAALLTLVGFVIKPPAPGSSAVKP